MMGVKVWTILAVFLVIATCRVVWGEEKQDSDLCTAVKISECKKNPKLTQCCVVKLNGGGGGGYECCSEEDYFDQWPKQDSDLCTPVKISECTKNPKLTQCCVVKLNGGGSGYKCCSEEDYFDQWPAMEKSNAQPRYELRRTPTLYISIGAPLGVVIFAIVCYCLCCK
jgi:hypothetical protein